MKGLASGTVIAERYVLETLIGHGGHGTVWSAHAIGRAQLVALKLVSTPLCSEPKRAEGALRRFRREVEILSQLRHPHTVRVLDAGVLDNGQPWLCMELLVGETLEDRLQRLRQEGLGLGSSQTAMLAEQVLRALQELHALGIVHRDVKPSNLFLCDHSDGMLHVKLIDFGIALQPTHGEHSTSLIGTPSYMAPEQLTGEKPTPGFDLYALGVVLFRCLTGIVPRDVSGARWDGSPPDPRSWCAEPIPVALVDAVLTALATNPAERWPSATAMRAAICGERSEDPSWSALPGRAVDGRDPTVGRTQTQTKPAPAPMRNEQRTALGRLLRPMLAGGAAAALLGVVWPLARQQRMRTAGASPAEVTEATPHASRFAAIPSTAAARAPAPAADGTAGLPAGALVATPPVAGARVTARLQLDGGTPHALMISRPRTGGEPRRRTTKHQPPTTASGPQPANIPLATAPTPPPDAEQDLHSNQDLAPVTPAKAERQRARPSVD